MSLAAPIVGVDRRALGGLADGGEQHAPDVVHALVDDRLRAVEDHDAPAGFTARTAAG
jgi:hypothetical protein